jgi:2-desacetyl-2-hydroxyethyl bacteriochlorophyllide A dehydrogenase
MPDLGLFSDGAFADYVCVKNAILDGNVFTLPDTVSDEEGAMVEPLAVALHAINRAKLDQGDRVIVTGAGTIGLCVLLLLKARGFEQIMVADMSPVRLALAAQLGAITVNIAEHSLQQQAEHQFGVAAGFIPAPAVNAIIDCTGSEAALQDAINCVQVSGKIIIVGTYSAPVTLDLTMALAKELDIITSLAYGDEFDAAVALLSNKKIDITALVSHRFSLAEIDQAFIQQANSEQSIKVMLQL